MCRPLISSVIFPLLIEHILVPPSFFSRKFFFLRKRERVREGQLISRQGEEEIGIATIYKRSPYAAINRRTIPHI